MSPYVGCPIPRTYADLLRRDPLRPSQPPRTRQLAECSPPSAQEEARTTPVCEEHRDETAHGFPTPQRPGELARLPNHLMGYSHPAGHLEERWWGKSNSDLCMSLPRSSTDLSLPNKLVS
jgi:hypothetical protein